MTDNFQKPELNLNDMSTVAPWLQNQTGMLGYNEAAHEYEWQYIPDFRLSELLERYDDTYHMFDCDPSKWAVFYKQEIGRAMSDCMDQLEKLETAARIEEWEKTFLEARELHPIILVESKEDPGKIKVWDGNHRIGFACSRHFKTVAALYGKSLSDGS